jgi:TetR/AcrR family transcriptional regulator, transcriptional repressor for nem operon
MARPRSFDEAEVVRSARNQFHRAGYAGTSLDDLCRVTGLGKGSLYASFGDNHDLFLRAFDLYCREVVAEARADLSGPGRAYPRLLNHLRLMAKTTGADRKRVGCLLAKGSAELSGSDPEVADRALATYADLQGALADSLAAAQREGDLARDADPNRLAVLLLAVLRGMEALGKAGADPTLIQDIAEQAIELLAGAGSGSVSAPPPPASTPPPRTARIAGSARPR